jgi:hypothetical protein
MPTMMAHHENPNDVFDNSTKKMIREPMKICPPKISVSNRKGFRLKCGLSH